MVKIKKRIENQEKNVFTGVLFSAYVVLHSWKWHQLLEPENMADAHVQIL